MALTQQPGQCSEMNSFSFDLGFGLGPSLLISLSRRLYSLLSEPLIPNIGNSEQEQILS